MCKMLKLSIFLIVMMHFQTNYSIRLAEHFKQDRIVPHIIPLAPLRRCKVLYPNVTLETGLLYRRGDLITEPNVTWDCDMDGYYTIIMTLLDDFKGEKQQVSELHWWLLMNIQKCCTQIRDEVFNYALLNRMPFEGAHRVLILVYKQASIFLHSVIDAIPNATRKDYRKSFTIREFAENHELGHPVAGLSFRLAY